MRKLEPIEVLQVEVELAHELIRVLDRRIVSMDKSMKVHARSVTTLVTTLRDIIAEPSQILPMEKSGDMT